MKTPPSAAHSMMATGLRRKWTGPSPMRGLKWAHVAYQFVRTSFPPYMHSYS